MKLAFQINYIQHCFFVKCKFPNDYSVSGPCVIVCGAQQRQDAKLLSIFFTEYLICSGDNVPNPLKSFQKMGLHQELLDKLDILRCKKPTPIEMRILPIILEGRDLLAEKSFENPNSYQLAYLIHIMQSCYIHQIVEDELESTDKRFFILLHRNNTL